MPRNSLTLEQIEELPDLVKSKKITTQYALKKITEYIALNEKRFRIIAEDSDAKQDIYEIILKSGEKLFLQYDFKRGKFINYIHNYVLNSLKHVCAIEKESKLFNSLTCEHGIEITEQKIISYSKMTPKDFGYDEKVFKPKKITPEELQKSLEQIQKITNKKISENKIKNKNQENQITKILRKIPIKSRGLTLLILILHSVYVISDESIKIFSEFTETDIDFLRNLILTFKDLLESKYTKIEKLKAARDKTYVAYKKNNISYNELKSSFCENDLIKAQTLKRQEILLGIRLKNENERIKEKKAIPIPSNRQIAAFMGINERTISYHMSYIKKIIENDSDKKTS